MAKLIEQVDTIIDVIPNDSEDIVPAPVVLRVTNATGIIRLTPYGHEDGTYVDIPFPDNSWDLILVKRVWATGTTATGIKAGYNSYK